MFDRPSRLVVTLSLATFACEARIPEPSAEGTDTHTDASTTGADTGTTGADTGTEADTDTETDTGTDSACDDEALQSCQQAVSTSFGECDEGCGPEIGYTCELEACRWACLAERDAAAQACFAEHCPAPAATHTANWVEQLACLQPCYAALAACQGDASCFDPDCAITALICANDCNHCLQLPPHLRTYQGSCEIPLGQALPLVRVPYTRFFLPTSNADWELGSSQNGDLSDCDTEPSMGGLWDDYHPQLITLCPERCADFEAEGAALFEFRSPPCN